MDEPDPLADGPLPDGKWGYIIYTEHYVGPQAGTVTIDRCDPHALVLDEILHEARNLKPRAKLISLRRASGFCEIPRDECEYPSHPLCFTGWLMTVDLPGRPTVYRIGKYRSRDNCWEASWPD